MQLRRIPFPVGVSGVPRPRLVTRSPAASYIQRGFKTSTTAPLEVPNFAFAFDIDGVLLRASRPLPGASQSLSLLQKQRIPFILLTNGGGMSEQERIAQLSDRLGVPLDPELIIQSHTPYTQLVRGKHDQEPLENKTVLVVGGDGDKCRDVAKQYGFKSMLTPGDIFMAHPSIWPFSSAFSNYYEGITQPLTNSIDPIDPSKGLKVDAILVFNDPRDWALDIQIIIDLLLSREGIVGTISDKNNRDDLPNRGYQQDGQPALYFSNPDLLWAAGYHQPRLGQGGFCAALEGVWSAMTGGSESGVALLKTMIGKPHKLTYDFAEQRLIELRSKHFQTDAPAPLETIYMIGDNPESDIRGAHSYISSTDVNWVPVLVKSGVYTGGTPAWTPRTIVDGVGEAVGWSLAQSNWKQHLSDK
ncbi:TIGR01456 family HAD hydrolase [Trichophyton interdigitale MR816]|uniref:TIGR01456 family HAD hydrolase n=1 Tax=Trichophyton interdigitale (strain MR816) TaxID=1215338 RepID=A0A059J333_TRIIM|nr:TIGR01456 family HAD hydrolase [Trichophyton interdigitale H6]KDB22098.1 TIGR01456 family HAD hydrolase [Trichophyton interdigitale MR816]